MAQTEHVTLITLPDAEYDGDVSLWVNPAYVVAVKRIEDHKTAILFSAEGGGNALLIAMDAAGVARELRGDTT